MFQAAKANFLEAVGGSSERDLPQGFTMERDRHRGKFKSRIRWGEKQRHIGRFDTPKQASAAYMSVRKDLAGVNPSALSADEVDAVFDAAKKKALDSVI
jgi:hypothetical protein